MSETFTSAPSEPNLQMQGADREIRGLNWRNSTIRTE
jgi:hypothetical protein